MKEEKEANVPIPRKPEQQADQIHIFQRSAEAGVDVLRSLLIPTGPFSPVGVGPATILHTTHGVPPGLSQYESRLTLCLIASK